MTPGIDDLVDRLPPELAPAPDPLRDFWRHDAVRSFFHMSAGTVLYALSALCIVYGIARLFGPLLARDAGIVEAVPCIAALNGYEIALLLVLVLIVRFRQVLDDAVSLVILISLFLLFTGIAQAVFANRSVEASLYLGTGCALLAWCKIGIMHEAVGLSWNVALRAGLLLFLGWNFLAAPVLAAHFDGEVAMVASDRHPWLWGWPPLLASVALMLLGAVRLNHRHEAGAARRVPFLRQPSLSILAALLLSAGAAASILVHGYMFHMQTVFGDFVPLFTLVVFLGVELHRSFREPGPDTLVVYSWIPALLWCNAFQYEAISATPSWGPGLFLFPPLCMMATAGYLVWMSRRRRNPALVASAFIYALGALLTVTYEPGLGGGLQWKATIAFLGYVLFLIGWYNRHLTLCWWTLGLGTYFLGTVPVMQSLYARADLGLLSASCGLFGAGTLLLYARFPRDLSPAMAWCAPFLLLLFGARLGGASSALPAALFAVAMTVACGICYQRGRNGLFTAVLLLPVVQGYYAASMAFPFWRYVILGFALLAGGACVSLYKGARIGETRLG